MQNKLGVIQNKRDRISLSYYLVSENRRMCKGYMPDEDKPSKLKYFLKLMEYQFLPHYFGKPPNWRMYLRRLNQKRVLPDFCVIGPIKSGTSDLAVNLMLHPNVIYPISKEFHESDPEKWRIFYPTMQQKNNHTNLHGLALSPFLAPYLHWMELTYNLSKARPNTKIVLILRDPVKRFYSHWKWEVFLSGKERARELPFLSSFSDYVDASISAFPEYPMYTVCGFDPLQTSIYWKAVGYWIKCFGRDNVLVLDVADYFFNGNEFLNKIYAFVGLPEFDLPMSNKKINENPIILPPPSKESISKLKLFFDPYNESLWKLLDHRFDWD